MNNALLRGLVIFGLSFGLVVLSACREVDEQPTTAAAPGEVVEIGNKLYVEDIDCYRDSLAIWKSHADYDLSFSFQAGVVTDENGAPVRAASMDAGTIVDLRLICVGEVGTYLYLLNARDSNQLWTPVYGRRSAKPPPPPAQRGPPKIIIH